MELICKNGLHYLRFPRLAEVPGLFHGFFLRWRVDRDGTPIPFNLGLGCGTPDKAVWHNRRQIPAVMGNSALSVFARQVHGREVAIWDAAHCREPHPDALEVWKDGDALITATTAVLLFIQVADCQPVVIIDPVRRVVANIHSGWRGSVQNIIGATVDKMIRTYGCHAEELICGIGPSLGPCCAEFVNFEREIPEPYWRYRRPGDHFDFWQISADQLAAAGVPAANISISGICTKCNPHLFFSYRRERQTGRFASVVGIQPA